MEHNRALKKMNGKQTRKKIKDKILNKIGPIRMGSGMIALKMNGVSSGLEIECR